MRFSLWLKTMITHLSKRIYRRIRHGTGNDLSLADLRRTNIWMVELLKQSHGLSEAMAIAVGGDFEAVGVLELETLKHFGLKPNDYLVDVGCGSGRLARQMSGYLSGKYLGIDIVPDLLAYARSITKRDDWRFEEAAGLVIPEQDNQVDMVCFFSVLTHLLHEQGYVYLQEAKRVLKPGGKIVFSFLDFTIEGHWPVFETTIKSIDTRDRSLNVFISKDATEVWAKHLEMDLVALEDADSKFIPLPNPIRLDSGVVVEDFGSLGQSVCVLTKRIS
jgi:SAM-dependent methyltransferase